TGAAVEPSALTRVQFGQLAEIPAELEWLVNITNAKTKRAYKIDVGELSVFAGLRGPVELRLVTRAHIITWRKDLEQLLTLASGMPGFISFHHYASDDGETFAAVEFASAEALAAWRDHPDHRKAQQRGRNEFYSEYEIINCAVTNKYGY